MLQHHYYNKQSITRLGKSGKLVELRDLLVNNLVLKNSFLLGEFVRANRKKEAVVPLLVCGKFFRQLILTKHIVEFLFLFRVARTKSPSGKWALLVNFPHPSSQ